MKYNFSQRTQDDVFDISNNLMVMLLVFIVVTVSLFPEIALATVDDSATASDGIKFIPKKIKDFMSEGGSATLAIGGGGIAVARAAMTGLSVPAVAGAGGIGLVAGYGLGTVLGISGTAIF